MSDDSIDKFLTSAASGKNLRLNLLQAQEMGLVPSLREATPAAVTIPPPAVYPTNLGPTLRVSYLVSVYLEALSWVELPEGQPRPDIKSKKYETLGLLKKYSDKANELFAALEQVRDEQESRLSPVFWAWWRISMIGDNRDDEVTERVVPSILTVFDAEKLKSPKWRAWFWRDGMSAVGEPQVLWPKAAPAIIALWREFERDVLDNPEAGPLDLKELWELMYAEQFEALKAEARHQRFECLQAVKRAHERNDLGLWLAEDLVKHLRLRKLATTTL